MARSLDRSLRLALCGALAATALSAQQTIGGCQLFPTSNVWNTPVLALPVDANSADYLATMGLGTGLHMDFGKGLWAEGKIGIPFDLVPNGQTMVPIDYAILGWADESDPGPFPIPLDPQLEGEPGAADGDRHILVVRQGACELYELYYSYPNGEEAQAQNDNWPDVLPCTAGTNGWCAASGAKYDLSSNALRPDGWTSADAAGLPILPGLARFEEVEAGEIRHALRFTAGPTQDSYVWPARHQAGVDDADAPPMGLRVRLRADYPLAGFSPHARRLLVAMKRYGMILADNGSDWYVSGIPNEGWDNDVLHELDVVEGSDFEVVDASSLMLDPDSGETRHLFTDGFENEVTLFANWSSHTP